MGLKELQAIQAKMEYQRKDEALASRNYMDLAKFLDVQHLPKYAEKIREIAKDEDSHHNMLDELLMSITNEIQLLEASLKKEFLTDPDPIHLKNAWADYMRRVQSGVLSGFDKSSWVTVAEDEYKIDHETASDYWDRKGTTRTREEGEQLRESIRHQRWGYECPYCWDRFETNEQLAEHIKQKHLTEPRMVGYKPEVHAPMFEHEIADTEQEFPTYDQLKRTIFDLAEGLHALLLPEMKRQYPTFDQPTIEAWAKVTVIEKRDWIYLDTHTARIQVNKDTGDVFIGNLGGAGKEMGNIKTLTAEQLFKAM